MDLSAFFASLFLLFTIYLLTFTMITLVTPNQSVNNFFVKIQLLLAVEINWWTADFSYIFGVLAIMYLIHPNCLKLFSEHAKQEKNI